MGKIVLSRVQLDTALSAYAAGQSTARIVDNFLGELGLEDTPENRALLRDQLRCVNPNDKRFAASKYGIQYDLAREAMLDVFREKARDYLENVFDVLVGGADDLSALKVSLQSVLDNASDFDVTSNTEYLNTAKTLLSLEKVEQDRANSVMHLLEILMKSVPALPSQSHE